MRVPIALAYLCKRVQKEELVDIIPVPRRSGQVPGGPVPQDARAAAKAVDRGKEDVPLAATVTPQAQKDAKLVATLVAEQEEQTSGTTPQCVLEELQSEW